MHLNVVNPNTTAAMTRTIAAAARRVARPDTIIRAVESAFGPASIEGAYDDAFAMPGLLARIAEAEAEGVDAHVIACFDPHEMSGGMLQRAMIALALSCSPKVLLADEPTTALDATVQIQILLLLRGLQREMGMAVIFVTHDIGVAIEISDRVAVMYGGRIVETGKLRDVVKSPQHPYTRGLLASTIHGAKRGVRLETIPGAPPGLDRLPPGCSFAPRCSIAKTACSQGEIPAVPLGPQRNVRCIKLVENIAVPVTV